MTGVEGTTLTVDKADLKAPSIAWPTVALFLTVLVVAIGVVRQGTSDGPTWGGVLLLAACAYAQFTVAHDGRKMILSTVVYAHVM